MIVTHIKKSYGKKSVLKDISFQVDEGMCIGILGGNGSGKSTLMNILSGVLKCEKGEFTYKGINMMSEDDIRSQVLGYVPQNTPLIEELSAYDNLRLWYKKADIKKSISSGVLGMLGIDKFLKVPVHKMSGGMKKRLAIGCAVASNPHILLLDEPTSALDLVCKEDITNYLLAFKKKGGRIVMVTHDVHELSLCDKLYILKNGTLTPYVFDGDIGRLAGSL